MELSKVQHGTQLKILVGQEGDRTEDYPTHQEAGEVVPMWLC